MKLTNIMRESVIRKITAKMFDKVIAESKANIEHLHRDIVDEALGPQQAKFFRSIPADWVGYHWYFYLAAKSLDGGTLDNKQFRFDSMTASPVPRSMNNNFITAPDSDIANRAEALVAAHSKIESDKLTFMDGARTLLYSCTTVEKLLIAWPGILEALGDEEFFAPAPPKPQLPAVQFEALAAIIGKYPPANDAEPALETAA